MSPTGAGPEQADGGRAVRERHGAFRGGEVPAYALLGATQLAAYVSFAWFLPRWFPDTRHFFGLNQYKQIGAELAVALAISGIVATLLVRRYGDRVASWATDLASWMDRPLGWMVVGAGAFVVFYLLRTRQFNQDSIDFVAKFQRDVPLRGWHVTHDEMWELYLHSRFWHYTNRWLGWDVLRSYQVASCLAGAAFVPLLVRYGRQLLPGRGVVLALLVMTGGFMQMFFGDAENYTLTAVLILAYLAAAAAHLKLGGSLVWPSVLLALALTSHVLAGWLLPSLAWLHFLSWRRGARRSSVVSAGALLAIVLSTLGFFHLQGLPLRDLYWSSHIAGHGGDIASMLVQPSLRYYLGVLNLLLLLVPAVTLLVPLVVFRRLSLDPVAVHLALASGFMLVYMAVWRATLGIYSDWNLFACVAVPLSVLIWWSVLRVEALRGRTELLVALGLVMALHSYSWIVANHYH